MQPPTVDLPPELADVLETGMILGQSQTLGLVAGRCSAAQAEALLRLRESKCYLRLAKNWKEFCPEFLKMSSSQVDRVIHCWQEFGPAFFELQKLMSISPTVYRSIEPAIKDGAIRFNDEAIALEPGNSGKIVAAVAELRRALPPKERTAPPTLDERLSDLDNRCEALVAQLKEMGAMKCQGRSKDRLEIVVCRTYAVLSQMKLELGIV
jgi:hypothetical protein